MDYILYVFSFYLLLAWLVPNCTEGNKDGGAIQWKGVADYTIDKRVKKKGMRNMLIKWEKENWLKEEKKKKKKKRETNYYSFGHC